MAQIKSFCLIFKIFDDLAEIIWPFLTNFSPFYQTFTTFLPHHGLNPHGSLSAWPNISVHFYLFLCFTVRLTEIIADFFFVKNCGFRSEIVEFFFWIWQSVKRGTKIKTQELNLIQLVLKIGLTRLGENYPKMIRNELGSVAKWTWTYCHNSDVIRINPILSFLGLEPTRTERTSLDRLRQVRTGLIRFGQV